MRQCGRLVLAGFCCSLVSVLAGSAGSAESDDHAMARAVLPPPLSPAQSVSDPHQPQHEQTWAARHEPRASGPRIVGLHKPHNSTSRHLRGEIASADPATAFSRKALAPSGYRKRHHLDDADLAARGNRQFDRQAVSSFTRDQAYADPRTATLPEVPFAVPRPPFGNGPLAPPSFWYPSVSQPPWLPGPTAPR
jgi:hypothetical protein